MIIHRQQLLLGASQACGTAVVIDVLRASTNIVTMLERGAERILPAMTLTEARALARRHPDSILAGERGGVPPSGFELGNSPVDAAELDLDGRTLILATSAGSRGIALATRSANQVLIGCFRNARAIAERILCAPPEEVTLVAMGKAGEEPTPEDDLAAEYIEALLRGRAIDPQPLFQEVRAHPEGQKFLDPAVDAYPRADLEYCLQADVSEVVPVVEGLDPPTIVRERSGLGEGGR